MCSFLSAFLIALVAVAGTASAQMPVRQTTPPARTGTVQSPIDETKESGERGGTEDINIGVGELQESETASPEQAVTNGAMPNTSIEPDEIDAKMADDDVQKGGNVEIEWKVEEGESAPPAGIDDVRSPDAPQRGSTDYFMEIKGIEGESTEGATSGVEPDEIDAAVDSAPLAPDFSILLGGGDADNRPSEEGLMEAADILLAGMKEQGAPAETLSINFEKIKATAKQPVKLLGFIPMDIEATVEIDAEQNVKVNFPWWAFLVTGEDGDTLGQKIFTTLSNVLKTKHDTVKNSINNVR